VNAAVNDNISFARKKQIVVAGFEATVTALSDSRGWPGHQAKMPPFDLHVKMDNYLCQSPLQHSRVDPQLLKSLIYNCKPSSGHMDVVRNLEDSTLWSLIADSDLL
jgi:hypothetical protein